MIFLSGVQLWKFGLGGALAAIAVPIAWMQMHDYQKQRVLTFINPEADPLGLVTTLRNLRLRWVPVGSVVRGFCREPRVT